MYMNYFEESMRESLHKSILKVINSSKKVDDDLIQLKLKLINTKSRRLPAGIISRAAELSGLERNVMTDYMEKNGKKVNFELWKDFIEEKFYTIVDNIKYINQPSTSSSSLTAPPPPSPPPLKSLAPEPLQSVKEEEEYRTYFASLNKIIRKDLPEEIKIIVHNKLEESLINVSDYQAQFLSIIHILLLTLKTHEFKRSNELKLEKSSGFNVLDLLPLKYIKDNDIKEEFTAVPIMFDATSSEAEDLKLLFGDQHLNLIHSFYFGAIGARQENLAKHPIQNAFFENLSANNINHKSYHNTKIGNEEMIAACTLITTNIKNMWNSNNIFNSLLDHLLNTLLKLHLAPNRTAEYKKYVKNKESSTIIIKEPFFHKGHKRSVIQSEIKKLDKLNNIFYKLIDEEKKNRYIKRIERTQSRILYFRSVPNIKVSSTKKAEVKVSDINQNDDDDENAEGEKEEVGEREASRHRIKVLKSVAKHLLLSSDGLISENNIKEEIEDVTLKELEIIQLIVNIIKPYIPSKSNRYTISYQLPFCIMANDVLRATGFTKFTRHLFPKPNFSRLMSLRINAPSLYQILTSGPDSLIISDFEHHQIHSIDYARSNKDAVFCSIFDMSEIIKACGDAATKFANIITIQPGLQTVRLLGVRTRKKYQVEEQKVSYMQRILNNPNIVNESSKDLTVLKNEVIADSKELKDYQSLLKKLLQSKKEFELSENIKDLKNKWDPKLEKTEKDTLYTRINEAKAERDSCYKSINVYKSNISRLKQGLYNKRMAVRFNTKFKEANKSVDYDAPAKYNIQSTSTGIHKSDNCKLDNPRLFTFSGTDNGIINMSTTVPLTFARFKFHLNLYNQYEILQNEDVSIEKNQEEFLKLPKAYTINSADVDIGCSYRKHRKKLERYKKSSTEGREVLRREEELSKRVAIEKFDNAFKLKEEVDKRLKDGVLIRNFYSSKRQARHKRTIEIRKQSYLDKLVFNEKNQIDNYTKGKKKLIMFVGDRGTGVGSRMKGHRRYGGKWLENLRSRTTLTCITNEHMTSQTCLFCFKKLKYPQNVSHQDGKKIRRTTKGALMCVNPLCVSVKNRRSTNSRDLLSALAIGISGLSTCLLAEPIPVFNPTISKSNTETFRNNSSNLLYLQEFD